MTANESNPWVPDAGTEPWVMESRRNKTRRGTTVVRLANLSNRVSGALLAWGSLAVAGVLLGRDSLTWSDPLTSTEAVVGSLVALAFSLATYVCLARPRVDIDAGTATVRNPVRVTEVSLSAVEAVDRTFSGHVRLHVGGRQVVLWGLEQPLRQFLVGYTENVSILLAESAACGGANQLTDGRPRGPRETEEAAVAAAAVAEERSRTARQRSQQDSVVSRWRVIDGWLLLLLAGWVGHLAWLLAATAGRG